MILDRYMIENFIDRNKAERDLSYLRINSILKSRKSSFIDELRSNLDVVINKQDESYTRTRILQIKFLVFSVLFTYIFIMCFSITRLAVVGEHFVSRAWVIIPITHFSAVIDFVYRLCHINAVLTNFFSFYFLVRKCYTIEFNSQTNKGVKDMSFTESDMSLDQSRDSGAQRFLND